jgi:hypothetical protein
VQELVEGFPESPIAAIDRGSADAIRIEARRTLVHYAVFAVIHVYNLNAQRRESVTAEGCSPQAT